MDLVASGFSRKFSGACLQVRPEATIAPSLECRPQRQLQPPCTLPDAEDLAEVRARQVGVGASQTRAIEQVDDVDPELRRAFPYAEPLQEPEILGVQRRPADVENRRRGT